MNKLIERLISIDQLNKIKYQINDYSPIYIQGIGDGSKSHLAYSLFELLRQNIVIVAENTKRAEKYLDDLNQLSNYIQYYPSLDTNFYNIKSIDDQKSNKRLETLINLAKGKNFITVTSIAAIRNKLTTLDKFNKSFVTPF